MSDCILLDCVSVRIVHLLAAIDRVVSGGRNSFADSARAL